MKIGVSSYSYSRLIRDGRITQFDSIEMATAAGFSFIEFSELDVPKGEDKLNYAGRLRADCTRGGNRLRGAIIGHGVVPVCQCLQIMKKAGYAGDVAIEFEGMEDPVDGIRIGLANLRAYLKN